MKLARRNNGITEIAVIGCKQRIPFCLAFPFGADQMNVDWLSLIRQAPLSAVKVLALSRNSGGTAGCFAPRPDVWTGVFLLSAPRRKAYSNRNRKDQKG